MNLSGIDHVALAVPDVERTVAWYVEVLGLERQHVDEWNGVPTFVGKGSTGLALFPSDEKTSRGEGGAMLHLAFRTDREGFVRAEEELRMREIAFHFEDHGISHSIYFRDLNDLRLEITTYDVSERSLG
ncbi:MAG TPA: VOC family protein [Chthoniobacterales bacterium]|jgi:catechol 2,3-dioxygenase-like lactoylglutathione lyase family enzyme